MRRLDAWQDASRGDGGEQPCFPLPRFPPRPSHPLLPPCHQAGLPGCWQGFSPMRDVGPVKACPIGRDWFPGKSTTGVIEGKIAETTNPALRGFCFLGHRVYRLDKPEF